MPRQFKLRADLAAGLSHRLQQLDPQKVVDTLGGKPSAAIRSVQKAAARIEKQNPAFMAASKVIYDKKVKKLHELREKHGMTKPGITPEAAATAFAKMKPEYDVEAAKIQATSTAKPDEVIEFTFDSDTFDKVLVPTFELTADTWGDSEGKNAQRNFIEVADALEGVEPPSETVDETENKAFETVLRTDNEGNA